MLPSSNTSVTTKVWNWLQEFLHRLKPWFPNVVQHALEQDFLVNIIVWRFFLHHATKFWPEFCEDRKCIFGFELATKRLKWTFLEASRFVHQAENARSHKNSEAVSFFFLQRFGLYNKGSDWILLETSNFLHGEIKRANFHNNFWTIVVNVILLLKKSFSS